MKKIYYFLRTDISYYPPCMSQLSLFKRKGYEVEVISFGLNDKSQNWLDDNGIKYTIKSGKNIVTKNKFVKYFRYITFKRFLNKKIKKIDSKNSIIWIGSEETALAIGNKLEKLKYVINIFELNDKTSFIKRVLIKKYARAAFETIVPEYNRAHILKSMWGLEKLPNIITNKPIYDSSKIKDVENKELREYKEKGYKVILYQGILSSERNIRPLAEALKKMNQKYILVIMASEKYKDEIQIIKKIYKQTISIGFIQAPDHLSITRQAHIGVTTYDHSSLNAVFCAPNKIYEYGMFNVPILANDIPGLKYTVHHERAGVCTDMTNIDKIVEAINEIEINLELYKEGTKKLIQSSSYEDVLMKILNKLNL